MADIYGIGALERDLNGVTVTNVRETVRRLKMFSPELAKQMEADLKVITKPVTDRAKGYATRAGRSDGLPLSRWNYQPRRPNSRGEYAPAQGKAGSKRWEYKRLRWDTGKVKAGIRSGPGGFRFASSANISTNDRWTSLWSITNSNAAGAVYELMGTGAAATPMVRQVEATAGKGKRLIWRAWNELRGDITVPRAVQDTISKYVGQFDQQLRRVGPLGPR